MELNEADENDYSFYDFWLEIQCSVSPDLRKTFSPKNPKWKKR